jgi:hypothetical protein
VRCQVRNWPAGPTPGLTAGSTGDGRATPERKATCWCSLARFWSRLIAAFSCPSMTMAQFVSAYARRDGASLVSLTGFYSRGGATRRGWVGTARCVVG